MLKWSEFPNLVVSVVLEALVKGVVTSLSGKLLPIPSFMENGSYWQRVKEIETSRSVFFFDVTATKFGQSSDAQPHLRYLIRIFTEIVACPASDLDNLKQSFGKVIAISTIC